MKQSNTNEYLKALNTLVNDNRITYAVTYNNNQYMRFAVNFNNEFICNVDYHERSFFDGVVRMYLHTTEAHPIRQGEKQLFKLNYDSAGYCSLAVTDSSNLEFFNCSCKRISNKMAKDLYNYVTDDNSKAEVLSHSTNKYINTYDFNHTVLFRL